MTIRMLLIPIMWILFGLIGFFGFARFDIFGDICAKIRDRILVIFKATSFDGRDPFVAFFVIGFGWVDCRRYVLCSSMENCKNRYFNSNHAYGANNSKHQST